MALRTQARRRNPRQGYIVDLATPETLIFLLRQFINPSEYRFCTRNLDETFVAILLVIRFTPAHLAPYLATHRIFNSAGIALIDSVFVRASVEDG